LFREGTLTSLSDAQLLERYLTARDEAAFEALVNQHGPMVLGLCRRLLRDPRDVEDAFQATFLVLVKKARGLWVNDSLGPWLHQVALRTASCALLDPTHPFRPNQ
jgi:DNA-directed RNA polymerase specialized sigma24 family protein